jgi:hypothetical protein
MRNLFSVFLFFIFFLVNPILKADSGIISLSDLTFSNDFEKETFYRFVSNSDSSIYFDLFFSSLNNKSTDKSVAIEKISQAVAQLKIQIKDKSEVKKVKIVYEYIHKRFLKVYKLRNSFVDIFESGEYNCVSATALYAVVLAKLSIPFQIMETPQHVFLVAYPNSSRVLVESTDPTKGYYQFNTAFINKYITALNKSKLISNEEFQNSSTSDLFNKYFFSSKAISMTELAGIQYSNYALYHIDENNYVSASIEVKKAYFLFPGIRHKYLLKSIIANLIENKGYEENINVSNFLILIKYCNEKDSEIGSTNISNEFLKILQVYLSKNGKFKYVDSLYAETTKIIVDSVLRLDIGLFYHYEMARVGYLNAKDEDFIVNHLMQAYSLKSTDADLRALILGYFETRVQYYSDSKSLMALSENFLKKFDFLSQAIYFNTVKAHCFLDLAYQNFFMKNITKGEDCLKQFEDLANQMNQITAQPYYVEKAYAMAAGEYYKRGNYAKAKQFLKTGLKYAPGNFGLEQRLSQIP